MVGAHQVAGKRNVFAFAVYSPGKEGINYSSSESCLGGRAAQRAQPPRLSEAEGGFSLEQISEECPVCECLVVRIQRTEHVMLYE
jgi:hypothetical protein